MSVLVANLDCVDAYRDWAMVFVAPSEEVFGLVDVAVGISVSGYISRIIKEKRHDCFILRIFVLN